MANNCNLKFNTTKVGTNLKAEVGNNDVLFNSLMSAVIDGSRPSGFNAEFESYYKTNYDSVPNVDNDNAEVVEAIKSFYNNKNFKVNEQTTNSAFISDVKAKGYTSTAAKVCALRTAGNHMLMFYHDDLIHGRLNEHADDRKNNLADRTIMRVASSIAKSILESRKSKLTKDVILELRKQLLNYKDNDFVKLEKEAASYSPQVRNQIAMFKDMTSDKVKFFTHVIQTDSRLGEIRFKKDDDLSQQEADWNESFAQDDAEDSNLDDADNNSKDRKSVV